LDTFFLLSFPPALAQSTQDGGETPKCAAALRVATNKITRGRNIKVGKILKKNDIPYTYKDYPKNRPFSYDITLHSGTSIYELNKLLQPISTDIIQNCNSVSIVSFNDGNESSVTFGLMKGGIVEKFKQECSEVFGDISPKKLPWGYAHCDV